jgi:hypothetical protein
MSSTIGDDIDPHVHLTIFVKQFDGKDPINQIAYSMDLHDIFDTPGSV